MKYKKPMVWLLVTCLTCAIMVGGLFSFAAQEDKLLTTLKYESFASADDTIYIDSAFQKPTEDIHVGDAIYQHGITVHPMEDKPAEIVYDISGLGFKTFGAIVGPDATWSHAATSVEFIVLVDGEEKFNSGVMRMREDQIFAVDITGNSTLTLQVTKGGDSIDTDASSWAMPTLSQKTVEDLKATLEKECVVPLPPAQNPEIAEKETVYISDMEWLSTGLIATEYGQTEAAVRDANIYNELISIGGEEFEKGIGMHPPFQSSTYVDINIEDLGFCLF